MAQQQSTEILWLSQEDIIKLGGGTSELYVKAIERVFRLHAKGDFVQPLKPYLRSQGVHGHIADRIIAMPAHIGNPGISGIKWVGSKHDNPAKKGLPRASALIILNDPETNYPVSVMEGSLISGMRTAAVTVTAAKYLAKPGFSRISLLGCGVIARMHVSSLIEQFRNISDVYFFDTSREASLSFQSWGEEQFPKVRFHRKETAEACVKKGELVIPCTITDQPYIPFEWLQQGVFISNISIMDLEKEVYLQVDKVVVDDWEQCNREKKVIHQLVMEGKFSRADLYAELGEIVAGRRAGRENEDEIILLNPMGMAIEDIACAEEVYKRALANGVGQKLRLY